MILADFRDLKVVLIGELTSLVIKPLLVGLGFSDVRDVPIEQVTKTVLSKADIVMVYWIPEVELQLKRVKPSKHPLAFFLLGEVKETPQRIPNFASQVFCLGNDIKMKNLYDTLIKSIEQVQPIPYF